MKADDYPVTNSSDVRGTPAAKATPHRRRSVSVCIRMTPAERAALDRNAKSAGMTRTDFLVRQAIDKGVYIFGTPGQMEQLIREVNKIGVNINQIAKHLNQRYAWEAKEELAAVHKDFSGLLDLVLTMTGK